MKNLTTVLRSIPATLLLLCAIVPAVAQSPGSHPMTDQFGHMGIGTLVPDKSAILDLSSTSAGFLLPRMTSAQRSALVNPAPGLIIFNTDTKTIEFNIGTSFAPAWDPVVTSSSGSGLYWQLAGNSGTNPAVNFLGTTDGQPLVVRTNNVERLRVATTGELGIGTAPVASRLLTVGGSAGTANVRLGSTSGAADASAWTPGANDGFVTADANGDLLKRSTGAAVGAVAWLKTGNGGAFTDGTDNLLGTTSNAALNVIVNGARAMRYEPNATSPNVIGGFSGNSVTAGAVGGAIVGGGASGSLNVVTDNYGVVGGGRNNRAGDNAVGVTTASYATVSGGDSNTASGFAATVGGGASNTASGFAATVGGGASNTASWFYTTVSGGNFNVSSGLFSTVGGGGENVASESFSTVGGGEENVASGVDATVSGGENNVASGSAATVGGGIDDTASGSRSTVAGGGLNQATGDYSFVGGGGNNVASGQAAAVGGGSSNIASGTYATIGGGLSDTVAGDYSIIPGGRGLTLTAAADRSFGFHANTAAGDRNMTISAPDIAAFGNTDLWLANNDNNPSELRFFEAYNTAGAFPNTANYSAFKAQDQTVDITYTLPASNGTSGQMLAVAASPAPTATAATLEWTTPANNDWSLTGNSGTTPGTNFLGTTDDQAFEIRVDNAGTATEGRGRVMRYEPNGTSANIIGGFNGNSVTSGVIAATISGGGANGATNSIASNYGTVGGGRSNTIGTSSINSTIGGGVSNQVGASAGNATVSGGLGNVIVSGDHTTIGGGFNNQINSGAFGVTLGGGTNNTVSSHTSVIDGGNANSIGTGSQFSTIGGGHQNLIGNSAFGSVISGGTGDTIEAGATYSTISGGTSNAIRSSSTRSVIAGGDDNEISADRSTISGGESNVISGARSAIAGGHGLTLSGAGSFGFLGANIGSNNMSVSSSNVAVFGNTDLWLANNDNTPSELRFFEAYNTAGAFPNTANYTAFKAQTQSGDITYTLPATNGTSGQALAVAASPAPTATTATLEWATISTSGSAWQLTGNSGTTAGTNFLGTTDDQAFEIRVNNAGTATEGRRRVLRFEPNGTSANIIGGFNGNSVTSGVVGATIAGGGVDGNTNVVTDDYGVVGGGRNNRAGNNGGTMSDRQYATVGGGYGNIASGDYATVSGGDRNEASGSNATVDGGSINAASGSYSTVGGGNVNAASGSYSTVGGGSNNITSGSAATVGGGTNNRASGFYATVGGGYRNIDSGDYSAISGGLGLTLAPTADRSFGFHANNNVGTRDITISAPDVAVFGNTDLWLANNDNNPSELRFFEAYNTAGAFPNTANYTAFKAQTQSGDITYTLPAINGTSGQVLAVAASPAPTATAATLEWATPANNDWSLTGNSGTTAGTNFLGTTDDQAFEIRVNNAGTATEGRRRVMRFEPNGTSANIIGGFNGNSVTGGVVGATISGGGSNGNTNVVTDDYGVVSGGRNNRAGNNGGTTSDSQYATVSGGFSNTASGVYATVGGGQIHIASGNSATISGGYSHTASGDYGAIGGGNSNTAATEGTTVGGGYRNTASATYATVGGGSGDTASGNYSVVGGGLVNTASGQYATVVGGNANRASATAAAIGGGISNLSSGYGAAISGGENNRATGFYTAVGGGLGNIDSSTYSAIPGGRGLTLAAAADRSFGFHSNNSGGTLPMTISAPDVAVFGNTDLWLANNDNTPSELRFFEAYNTAGAFPSTANYTAFRAQNQTSNITYTLPAINGTSGQVLAVAASPAPTATAATLEWASVVTTPTGPAGGDLTGNYPNPSIASSAVTSAKILDSTITTADISAAAAIPYSKLVLTNSIQNSDIVPNAVTTSKVANGTVTTSKLADSAVSGLKLLTFAVTNRHIADGAVTLPKLSTTGASSGQVITYNGTTIVWGNSGSDWSLTGNSGTVPGTNFLGTTDNQAFEIRVDNAGTATEGRRRVLRFEPNATSANIIGGFNGNSVTGGVVGATIAGGGEDGNTNRVTDNYGVVGGGANNRAGDNAGGTNDRVYATVSGGFSNTASGGSSAVGGGNGNTASSDYSTVGGGLSNTASGYNSTVGGGWDNMASGARSTVGGGDRNTASESSSTVGGGQENTASGLISTVGGGEENTASSDYSTVGGGFRNMASGVRSTVGGGAGNTSSSDYSTVGGGLSNSALGNYSTVGGGEGNTDSGDHSAIPGGRGLTLVAAADRSFGFHANTAAGNRNMTISAPEVAVFGNTDLWLANNDNTPSELRFFEAYNTAGTFPNTANYTAFKAATTQTSDITYTLPAAAPAGAGNGVMTSTAGGTMSWGSHRRVAAVAGTAQVITDAAITATSTVIVTIEGTVAYGTVTARGAGTFTVTTNAALTTADFINYIILP